VDYLALSHLHINYSKDKRVYSGPIFPNNLSELEELKAGSFYIFDNGKIRKEEIKLKEVISLSVEIDDAFKASDKIISILEQEFLKDKIIMLKLFGILKKGKISDIEFSKIEDYTKKKEAYVFLKSISKLHGSEPEIKYDYLDAGNLEGEIIKKFNETNPGKYNSLISPLMKSLQSDKLEDEKNSVFEERIYSEIRKIVQI
jgi:hypothetical protein